MENPTNFSSNEIERRFLFVLGSSRRDGNTELLAKTASEQLPANITQSWLRLQDLPLPPFTDIRHDTAAEIHTVSANEQILLDETVAATDLVIASPLYWYSVSASTKLYLDYWTYWLRLPEADFKARMRGKTMWAISALSDEDLAGQSKPLVETLRLTAEYLAMNWGGVLLGYGNRPGDVASDENSMHRAERFFESVM